jgi:hypothetical protein
MGRGQRDFRNAQVKRIVPACCSLREVSEFWEEEEFNEKREMGRFLTKWAVIFAGLIAFVLFVLWWASSALSYSASRVGGAGKPEYKVTGVITDARSGAPVPWAVVRDDPEKRPPRFETTSDFHGKFELKTLPEPHDLIIAAYGHKAKRIGIGRSWFLWMPSGEEELEIVLDPE